MSTIECLYSIGEMVSYTDYRGNIMTNLIEAIYITQGSSTYRTDTWVGSAKTKVETNITYKLANTPAGYILSEGSLFKKKEVVSE